MKLLELTDATSGVKVIIVAQNIFAIFDAVNEVHGRNETRIFGASDDYIGVKESKEEIIKELASI